MQSCSTDQNDAVFDTFIAGTGRADGMQGASSQCRQDLGKVDQLSRRGTWPKSGGWIPVAAHTVQNVPVGLLRRKGPDHQRCTVVFRCSSLCMITQAWQPTQVSRSITSQVFFSS
jgi:hypothetical protein